MIQQKVIQVRKGGNFLLGSSGDPTYLCSQCGFSNIQIDLDNGWLIKAIFEDNYYIVLIMEKK